MAKQLIKKEALDEFGKIWVKTLKEQLLNNRPYPKKATGALINSVSYRLKQNDQADWEITLLSEDYLKFVDKGVSGTIRKYNTPYSYKTKKPPINKIQQWAQIKGIPKEAAYPIQNKIFRFGLKPTNVINKTIREIEYKSKWIQKFEGDIANTIIENIKEQFGYSKTT
jgi:hypothetical protein